MNGGKVGRDPRRPRPDWDNKLAVVSQLIVARRSTLVSKYLIQILILILVVFVYFLTRVAIAIGPVADLHPVSRSLARSFASTPIHRMELFFSFPFSPLAGRHTISPSSFTKRQLARS